jgi:glycosyltransferase involved in cell wall biosynthesis
MVTIIIPTYNGSKLLKQYSLPSLLKQGFSDWEALVINDGSTDNSSEIIKKFAAQDKRIKLIEQPINLGLAAALNLGIKIAQGEYIAILEHDDIWLPEKLNIQITQIKSGKKISTCNAIVYDTKSKRYTKINGGNLSCFVFNHEAANLIFPIPEDRKYLGIEDGIITAELEITKATGSISENDLSANPNILTIMNSNENTLSGQKNSLKMEKRYKSVIDLYIKQLGKYKELDKLINFWQKHYRYNHALSNLPKFIQKIIYFIINISKTIKNRKQINVFRKSQYYQVIKKYREFFD